MRLGLFGGSFNPIHHGHLLLAQQAQEYLGLDKVLFVPAASSPFKPDDPSTVSAEHRLEMIRLAIDGAPNWEVSSVELDRGGVSYTVDTLRALGAEQPDAEWVLLLGADSVAGFSDWREPEEILERALIAWYPRPGGAGPDWEQLSSALGEDSVEKIRAGEIPGPRTEISATEIRARVFSGLPIRYWLPDPVSRYIQAHHLYGN